MELKIMSLVEESTMLSARLKLSENNDDETDSKREQNLSQASKFVYFYVLKNGYC